MRRFGIALALLLGLGWVILAGMTQPAVAQQPFPQDITLRVQTPNYVLGDGRLRVAGYALDTTPGAPALPLWNTVIELPASGDWQVSYLSPGNRLLAEPAKIAAAPAPDRTAAGPHGWQAGDAPSVPPVVDRPDPAIYAVDAFYPASPVQPGPVQWQRGRRLLALRVFPFQYNPVTGELRYHPDLEITVRVAETAEAVTTNGALAAGSNGFSRSAAAAETAEAVTTDANPPASAAGALRIRTGARGLYRLTYDDLLAAGAPLESVDPATFALSTLGQPVASELSDDGDSLFEPGELLIFYAEPYQGRYETSNVYWLTYGAGPGLRIAARAVTPTGAEPLLSTITQTLRVERDLEYRSDFPRPRDADHWFDWPLSPDSATGVLTATRTYDLALDDFLASGSVQLRAALHGNVDRPANPDKSIAIQLNSHAVGMYQWEGLTYFTAEASAPAAWLDGAPNQVTLTAALSQLPGVDFYSVSPDWVELSYPALAEAEGERIYIEGLAPGASEVVVAGFSAAEVRVYDVRTPRQPVRLTTTEAEPVGAGYRLHFWDADLPQPSYFLAGEAGLLAPLAIEPDTASDWRSPDQAADYIAIVHAALWDAIQPLLDQRAAEGLRVAKVDVQDVYDEFGYGLRDPEAIRSFLSYAYHYWNGQAQEDKCGTFGNSQCRIQNAEFRMQNSETRNQREAGCIPGSSAFPEVPHSAFCTPHSALPAAEPPRYVLLVGDGHYDFTGVSGATLPNLIPPYLLDIDPWLGETAADNRYASVDGPDDFLPDMHIGRIPANSPADVTAAVNKILAYETAAPAGDWQQRVVFVADNNLDPVGDFHALSDATRLPWLPVGYDDRTIYYNRDYFSGSAMRTAIKAAFDDDALLIQWFGHGSKFRWGSISMYNIFDPPALAANDTWPFHVDYSCWTGYFINLFGNYPSLGETFLLTPQRGSAASLAPSGLHVGDALVVLNQGLVDALFRQRLTAVGQAVDAGRLYYFGHSGGFYDVIDTSALFGDPALRLRLPTLDLAGSQATVSPAQAAPGQTLHYTVTLHNSSVLSATDVTVAVDYADAYGQVTSSTPPALDANGVLTWTLASLAPGATQLTFDLLLDPTLPAGSTAIHASVTVRAWGAVMATFDPASQAAAAPDLSGSTLANQPAWSPPGLPVHYTLALNNSGNAPSAPAWVTVTLPADLVAVSSADLAYDAAKHRLTWQGLAPAGQAVTLTFAAAVSSLHEACGQAGVAAAVVDQLGQATALAAAVNVAAPDVDCDGDVDIVDIQHVTARWGAAQGDPLYHPRYDLDGDAAIGLWDVMIVAARWK